ncbi:hypothetical protein BCR34DRAFT_590358 [Clohesyomyces aquaticus]|uniref:Uncharacterized protein n=1 Tax=Clohesyomyces aquaticus TaxID=1231657 RepID=A0A1Y1ZAK7_9PLEO|nr:hypothetical protein BCR34DRAFT_590358 [Clohesyomyces aquaticus]
MFFARFGRCLLEKCPVAGEYNTFLDTFERACPLTTKSITDVLEEPNPIWDTYGLSMTTITTQILIPVTATVGSPGDFGEVSLTPIEDKRSKSTTMIVITLTGTPESPETPLTTVDDATLIASESSPASHMDEITFTLFEPSPTSILMPDTVSVPMITSSLLTDPTYSASSPHPAITQLTSSGSALPPPPQQSETHSAPWINATIAIGALILLGLGIWFFVIPKKRLRVWMNKKNDQRMYPDLWPGSSRPMKLDEGIDRDPESLPESSKGMLLKVSSLREKWVIL